MYTWIDKRNFNSDGSFKENYFNLLFDTLRNSDNLLLLINPLNTIEFKDAYKLLEKNNIPYIDIFKCYKKIDVLKSIIFSLHYFPIKRKIIFKKQDITEILKNKFLEHMEDNIYAQYYLMYYSIMRVAESGIKFDRIIYTFENQPWEKVLCYAVKKFMPDTKLIGCMHTMTLSNLVSIFPGEYERDNMPQPDYIFTTGKLTADELKKYWKPEKIIENCALRYDYLFKLESLKIKQKENADIKKNSQNQFKVLLALSFDYKKSIEMIKMTYYAFKDKYEYQIIIKSHPTYILNFLELNIESENFILKNEPVEELLVGCDLVLNSDSMVALEGLKLGIPMLEIDIDDFIPLSRFYYCPDIQISAGSSEEIFEKTEQILNWTDLQKKMYFEKAEKFLEYCFNRPNENYIKMFLEI